MRVLFVSFPWVTHFQPMAPLGWALQTAGHEVRVASGPELTDAITKSGLTAVPVGSDEPIMRKFMEMSSDRAMAATEQIGSRIEYPHAFTSLTEDMLTWHRLRWLTVFLTEVLELMNGSMIEELVEYCRWWQPDLVLWDYLSYAGSLAATAVGAAQARMTSSIDVDAQFRRHFVRVRDRQPLEDREDALADWLGGWARKYGVSFSEEMVTGQFTVDQMLGSMRLDSGVPTVALRYIPYHGAAVVPAWARQDPPKPRVLATFGVSHQKSAKHQPISIDQLQAMLDSLADLDIELVVTAPEQIQNQLDRIPANTRMVEFVPLNAIIASCSAVIHHGGVPAFLSAIEHGVPQLMVSRAAVDFSERGPRLRQSGAGLWIPPDQPAELAGPRIRERLVRLLDDPAFRHGTERLRTELLATPTPSQVVPDLERLTNRYRTH